MANTIGNLEVGVSTNLASLYTGLQQAADRIGQFGDKVSKQMDAIGNMADGDLLDRFIRIETMPHVPANASMELADGVSRARHFERQNGHAK